MEKVALVGFGSQGKRIAEAISAQPDLQLVGVVVKEPDVHTHIAFKKGFTLYAVNNEDIANFKDAKIDVQGSLSDLLSQVDVVVDATPIGIGRKNKEIYAKFGVKAIFQAGEHFDIADVPVFVCQAMYEIARKAKFVRIPTPYTISLFRTLNLLDNKFGIRINEIACSFVIPGTELMRGSHGPVDTIILARKQLLTLIKNEFHQLLSKKIVLASFKVSTNLLGVASLVVRLCKKTSKSEIIDILSKMPRIILVRSDNGLDSTDSIFEYIRRVVRPSADVYEVCVWYDQIEIYDDTLKLIQVFDPHCVQTPEIIDAIRALASKKDMETSFNQTNKALKILDPGVYP